MSLPITTTLILLRIVSAQESPKFCGPYAPPNPASKFPYALDSSGLYCEGFAEEKHVGEVQLLGLMASGSFDVFTKNTPIWIRVPKGRAGPLIRVHGRHALLGNNYRFDAELSAGASLEFKLNRARTEGGIDPSQLVFLAERATEGKRVFVPVAFSSRPTEPVSMPEIVLSFRSIHPIDWVRYNIHAGSLPRPKSAFKELERKRFRPGMLIGIPLPRLPSGEYEIQILVKLSTLPEPVTLTPTVFVPDRW